MTWTAVGSNAVTFADGNAGHVYTFPSGAPSPGDLDVLCVNSDTTVSTPSTGGAAWTLGPTFVGNQGSYLWYRVATGGEGSTTTITTAGNFPTAVAWSRWRAGTITADVNAIAHVDNSAATTTPAVTTPALAQSGELVIAFAALAGINASGIAPATPVWSAGYTNLLSWDSGVGATDVAGFQAYNNNAGPAAESPNVSWTNSDSDRYILVQAFKTTIVVPAAGGGGLGFDPVTSLILGDDW